MFGKNPFSEYRATQEQVQEAKFVIPEEIPANERTAFHGAAAAAAKAGKKSFNFGGKSHPVTMQKDTAKAIADQKEDTQVDEAKKQTHMFDNEKDARAKAKEIGGKYVKGTGKSAGKHAAIKEGYMKDLATADAKSDAEKAKVAADFKKRRKMKKDEKSDVNMNPKMGDGKAEKGAPMESTIREKLLAVLEGDRAKHYKGATKPEDMHDKTSPGGKEMMNQPTKKDDTEEKGHQDAVKAAKTGPQAKPRSGGDATRGGDQKIIPSATPVKGIKSTMESYASMYKKDQEVEESYTHEFDYAEDGKHTAKAFVDKAKKAGMKAKIHSDRGPGGGNPVVHLGHKDTKKMHSFLKKHYDQDMHHDDLEYHKI